MGIYDVQEICITDFESDGFEDLVMNESKSLILYFYTDYELLLY